MRGWLVVAALLVPSVAGANDAVRVPELLSAARSEVLLFGSGVNRQDVAEALRVAMVKRGVKVYLITSREGLRANDGFVLSLLLAGAAVYTPRLQGQAEGFVIVDGAHVVTGDAVGLESTLIAPVTATWKQDPALVQRLRTWFVDVAQKNPALKVEDVVKELYGTR